MADITPLISSDRQVIQSYSAQGFKISGKFYSGPVIVFPDRVLPWPIVDRENLLPADFEIFARNKDVDILLLGCGGRAFMAPIAIKTLLKSQDITIDTMDTGAACRTYNVLLADGRRIAAALLPIL